MASAAAEKCLRPSNDWSSTSRRCASCLRGGGVERVTGDFRDHPRGGERPQLVVHEREDNVAAACAASSRRVTLGITAECNREVAAGNSKDGWVSAVPPDGYAGPRSREDAGGRSVTRAGRESRPRGLRGTADSRAGGHAARTYGAENRRKRLFGKR